MHGGVQGDIPCVVAWGRILLFVGGLVFFIHHDQVEFPEGKQEPRTGPEDEERISAVDPFPDPCSLGFWHHRVVDHHFVSKEPLKPLDHLGGQCDLRHEEQCLSLFAKRFLNKVGVHFCLARGGHPVK